MPRRNRKPTRRQKRRITPGQTVPRAKRATEAAPESDLSKLVLPTGKCYFRSRHGKLIFKTAQQAQSALNQAASKRRYQANGHVEKRFYPCPEGGCGGFHLTSRDEYEERSA